MDFPSPGWRGARPAPPTPLLTKMMEMMCEGKDRNGRGSRKAGAWLTPPLLSGFTPASATAPLSQQVETGAPAASQRGGHSLGL